MVSTPTSMVIIPISDQSRLETETAIMAHRGASLLDTRIRSRGLVVTLVAIVTRTIAMIVGIRTIDQVATITTVIPIITIEITTILQKDDTATIARSHIPRIVTPTGISVTFSFSLDQKRHRLLIDKGLTIYPLQVLTPIRLMANMDLMTRCLLVLATFPLLVPSNTIAPLIPRSRARS